MSIEYTNVPDVTDAIDEQPPTTPTDSDDADEVTNFHPAAIIRRVDGADELNDAQQSALAIAVRNPHAGVSAIGDELDVSPSMVNNTIWGLKIGGFDADAGHLPALNKGSRAYRERTLKQRAAIHYLAARPNAYDVLTYKQTGEKAQELTGVSMHWKTIYDCYKNFPELIHERRQWLDDADIKRYAPDERVDNRAGSDIPIKRQLLEAGITDLPEENIDLPPIWESGEIDRDEALEAISDADTDGGSDAGSDAGSAGGSGAGSGADSHITSALVDDADSDDGTEAATDAASADETDAGSDGTQPERTTRKAGNAGYTGPSTGLDLTSGRAAKTIVERARADAGDELAAAIERIHEEDGPLGQDAYKRSVDLDSREDVENEIRRLRMLVASQGELLASFREAMNNLSVTVSVDCDAPEVDDE